MGEQVTDSNVSKKLRSLFRRKPRDLRCVRCGCPFSWSQAFIERCNAIPWPTDDPEVLAQHYALRQEELDTWGHATHLWIAPELRGSLRYL